MKIIANPRAGSGRGLRAINELKRKGMSTPGLEIVPTRYPGHATELARQLVEGGAPRIGVMGGDGTIGEVAASLVGTPMELAVLSIGTGNDIARSLGLPYNNLAASLEVAESGKVVAIDVGVGDERPFVSVLGVGFPALVAAESNRLKWLPGQLTFAAAICKVLWKMTSVEVEIALDSETLTRRCTSVLVLNTPFTGGGLRLAPQASVVDGLFDVVLVDEIAPLDLIINLPKVYTGHHLTHPRFSLFRSSSVSIRAEHPVGKMFDGDSCGTTPVEARVMPGALKVVHPLQ